LWDRPCPIFNLLCFAVLSLFQPADTCMPTSWRTLWNTCTRVACTTNSCFIW
jgi:hypothetical protein